jgi:hypothetical protein
VSGPRLSDGLSPRHRPMFVGLGPCSEAFRLGEGGGLGLLTSAGRDILGTVSSDGSSHYSPSSGSLRQG